MILKRSGHEKKARRAFTLTETAIVLGVVGIVLGGIWVAAGSVYQKVRVNNAYEEIRLIVDNMHSIGMGMTSTAQLTTPTGGGEDQPITPKAFTAGVFPASVLTAGALPARNPWNGNITIVGGQNTQSFKIQMDNIPSAECIQLFHRFLDSPDLTRVRITTGWINPTTVDGSMACPVAAAVTRTAGLEFSFRSQAP
ncbi:MAG: type 4 pilus major pilin [Alphaproteobacteria bacterium]|nr:type 4 pilus major pilin [Alphaproteobacteria bacterium]